MTADEWVCKLNKLGAEIDDLASSIHPSAWAEQLFDLRARYRKLAAMPTHEAQQSAAPRRLAARRKNEP